MKIAFFTETYLPELNGVSITLAYTKKELEAAGHDVYIFAPKITGYKDKDPRIVRLNSFRIVDSEPKQRVALPIPNESFRKTFTVKLDVVHSHGGGFFSFLGYQLALAKGYPLVLTYHSFLARYTHYIFNGRFLNERMAKMGSRVVCNWSDVVIAPSAKIKDLLDGYGVTKPIEVVPNVFDLSKFGGSGKGFLHKHLSLAPDKSILLTVSRVGKEKSIDFLLRSYAKIAKQESNSVFVIVGDGPERKALEKLSKSLKISKRVIFTGFISKEKLPAVYADSDVFLFASTSETQGMVVPEAAASGLPLVLVKDAAFAGAIEEGKNGYSVSENEAEFADKVLELLANQEKREEFGLYSKKLIKENFSTEKNIQKLVDVYEKAIQIRKGKPRLSNRLQGGVKELIGFFKSVRELNRRLDLE